MPKLYYNLPNGNSFAHVSRSGTSTLAAHALKDFFPDDHDRWKNENNHAPQWYLQETWANRLPKGCLVMARNPIERLQSLIARNNYDLNTVDFCLRLAKRYGKTSRPTSKRLSIVTLHHLMPLDFIAENDSHFIKFPEIKEACSYLGLNYDDSLHINKQRGKVTDLPVNLIENLKDSTGIWEALTAGTSARAAF